MSNTFSLVIGTALLVSLATPPGSASTNSIYSPLVAGNTDFALNLYGQLAASNSGNLFFSPYSISTCFGMVYAGARGETALQMAETLDFSTNQPGIGPEFGALQAELNAQQGVDGISLSIANGLWAQTNFPFLPSFLDNASNNFDASVQPVDFITDAPEIADQINAWVAGQTDGMISNLLQPGTLTPFTRLALVNAIYFNGEWLSTFDTNLTRLEPFYVSPGQFVYAPTMEQTETVRYYEDNFLQAIELPYTNENLSMVVLLPQTNGPTTLPPGELSAALNGFAPWYVDVRLPKFRLETTINLIPILEEMGLLDAFNPYAADFSGIDGANDLFIGTATHKAVVEVNETGTVAAGSTIIIIPILVAPAPFQVDHPFIFLIRDTTSGSILFMGRVDDPTGGAAPASPLPLIQTSDGSFGIRNHQFGFNIASTNATAVMVEKCTDITSGNWSAVRWVTLTNGSAYFSEPLTPNSPACFYRVWPQ